MSHASTATATALTFAPSELVLLNGERFAPEAGMLTGKEELLTTGAKVHSEKLMDAAVHAAVWALVEAGTVRLETRKGKALFGLIKTEKTHLVRGAGGNPFPPRTLESFLAEQAGTEPELDAALAAYIGAETTDVPGRVLGIIKAGMGERNLLDVEQKKVLMVFSSVGYSLPAGTRDLAAREPVEPIIQRAARAEQTQSELYRAVHKAIDSATVQMTPSQND
ncbi:hypothetical protein [Longimicrobium terrae]|uniref:GPP34 family phosphoprotein n=1 Tax=Longimicrobium terrae TaxID=1639882 RepID=A0A841H5Y0_9BACT|nr:hypothetical protein [Longimicrobium terrae]MBB4639113.1 hypothetical protein [Longimicrobium terrae]MBB6073286.1 hypothetical protein [Longimicrobium terrae]NNC28727.1 hypothetical protein [Longimicrobium terrae]